CRDGPVFDEDRRRPWPCVPTFENQGIAYADGLAHADFSSALRAVARRPARVCATIDNARDVGTTRPSRSELIGRATNGRHATTPSAISRRKPKRVKNARPMSCKTAWRSIWMELEVSRGCRVLRKAARPGSISALFGNGPNWFRIGYARTSSKR